MKRPTIILVTGIFALAVSMLVALWYFSDLPNRRKNGFNRTRIAATFELIHERRNIPPLQTICGATAGHYFFSVPNPRGVIMFDSGLVRQDTLVYGLPVTSELLQANNVYIDSPDVYFFANNLPALFRGRLNELRMDSVPLGSMPFTRSAWLSPGSAILRTLMPSLDGQIFQRVDMRDGKLLAAARIVDQQGGGGFESDGSLIIDRHMGRIWYVQYYTNKFYCMDSALHVLYTAHTVDTVSSNPVVIRRTAYMDKDKISPASPRVEINQVCCEGNGFLFVSSGLRADNDTDEDFRSNAVIDLYALDGGHYSGSFYLPLPDQERIRSMQADGEKLIVLYKNSIRIFWLHINNQSLVSALASCQRPAVAHRD